jgi:thioredoxin reductase (NADPH)
MTPGVERLTGAGVYYGAAMTEAKACVNEDVYIIGGANSAGQAAMYFSKYARQVTMLVRAESLKNSMSKYLIDQIAATSNIEVKTQCQCSRKLWVTAVWLACASAEMRVRRPYRRLLSSFSSERRPTRTGFRMTIMRDANGFVLSGSGPEGGRENAQELEPGPGIRTCSRPALPGIFVAGDVRHGSIKRVASAVGEGSISVQFIHQYLAGF